MYRPERPHARLEDGQVACELLYHDSELEDMYRAERAWSRSTHCKVQAQKLIDAPVLLRRRRFRIYIQQQSRYLRLEKLQILSWSTLHCSCHPMGEFDLLERRQSCMMCRANVVCVQFLLHNSCHGCFLAHQKKMLKNVSDFMRMLQETWKMRRYVC